MSKFTEHEFEQKLFKLKDSHDSINSLSTWCLSNVDHHARVVATWLGALKKVKTEHRILLFYLANDIIQYSKKKGLPYVGSYAPALQKATTMVRDPAIRNKILRIFKIWDERNVYDETFLVDLSSLLTRGHKSANRIDLEDFQPNLLYSRLKSCQNLEADTDDKMKVLVENPMPLTDTERLRTTLKNRKASEDVILEIDEGIKKINVFISALEAEIKERIGLIDLLEISEQYYDKELGEAKIVSNAYKCFTNRVKTVKKKLDEKIEVLPSPVPTPSPTAPSPEPDADERAEFEFEPVSGAASFMDGSLFINESVASEFENYYGGERIPSGPDVAYSPESAYNGMEAYHESKQLRTPVARSQLDGPPVFNYFRPIVTDVTPLSVRAPRNAPDNSFLDDSTECKKIEVITSPSKERASSLSTLLQTMVSETLATSLPPPPVPPALDFAAWGANSDYWESPESPPLFEKEGLPAPTLSDVGPGVGTDVDMRAQDVDHRNLISLTGGTDQDWDFPPHRPSTDNEDMEMSDDDVGAIEEIDSSKTNLDYTSPAFPILPIKTTTNNVDSAVEDLASFPIHAKPVFQDVDKLMMNNQSAHAYQLAPPPPPPPPLNKVEEAPVVSTWPSPLPPPPPFDMQPRPPMVRGPPFANAMLPPRGFEPPPPPPPFPPLNRFQPCDQNVSTPPRFESHRGRGSPHVGRLIPSFDTPQSGNHFERPPGGNHFERPPVAGNHFERPPVAGNHFERSPNNQFEPNNQPRFYPNYRPRFDNHRGFSRGGGHPLFRPFSSGGQQGRFQSIRPHRQRFPTHRF